MIDLSHIQQSAQKVFKQIITGNGNHLTPMVRLTVDGQPFGSDTKSRILSVELTDNRGFEADDLTITLSDHDGKLAIPTKGGMIKAWLGYKETGVIYKGEFKISEFTHSGAPDMLSITAKSADLSDKFAEQEERSWHQKTLFDIIKEIAEKHQLQYQIDDIYQKNHIEHIDQTNESDGSFITRLSDDYDAIATIKNKMLLFMPRGAAKTATGTPIPEVVITRMSGDSHSFTYSSSDSYNAVRSYYTDKKSGKKTEVVINKDNLNPIKKTVITKPKTKKGKIKTRTVKETKKIDTEGLKIKTLRHLYATKASAESGARTAFKKIQRGAATFSLSLATGRPDLYPETPIRVQGFKAEIDIEQWLIKKISHSISDGGYVGSLELESRIG